MNMDKMAEGAMAGRHGHMMPACHATMAGLRPSLFYGCLVAAAILLLWSLAAGRTG